MALLDGHVLAASSPAPTPPPPVTSLPRLSRKRRMNFFDIANLLDSDGNLQNEMMVFAFAATMLSTIPILLGNEFDINVGLKRKKRDDDLYQDEVKAASFSQDSFPSRPAHSKRRAGGRDKNTNEAQTVSFYDSFTEFPEKTLTPSVEDAYSSRGADKLAEKETQEPKDTWLKKLLYYFLR
ncbi:hypothetical protein E2C01_020504 [Portunus trituberculatus]|uniref:Uncharacterized protein n=1 Tax=Portunus trituberculatus TaxID=210409 RepID=A0A5B7E1N6_PORTR|nr:hypothetical protein [Portunus trituberculatus]